MRTLNYRTRLVELASEINSEMPHFVMDKVRDALNVHSKALRGSRVLLLGVAYKKEIDDVRECPALDVLRLLADKGADVRFHDPYVPEIDDGGRVLRSVPLDDETLLAADCILITTDHEAVDYSRLLGLGCPVVGTRNTLRGQRADNIIWLEWPHGRSARRPADASRQINQSITTIWLAGRGFRSGAGVVHWPELRRPE
jgi:UDP-N-acetyl-D-glucosamine dehydrogenase